MRRCRPGQEQGSLVCSLGAYAGLMLCWCTGLMRPLPLRSTPSPTGVKVLVDPWLVGRLEFAGQTWLYSGSKRVARPETIDVDRLAAETDFILLTQVRARGAGRAGAADRQGGNWMGWGWGLCGRQWKRVSGADGQCMVAGFCLLRAGHGRSGCNCQDLRFRPSLPARAVCLTAHLHGGGMRVSVLLCAALQTPRRAGLIQPLRRHPRSCGREALAPLAPPLQRRQHQPRLDPQLFVLVINRHQNVCPNGRVAVDVRQQQHHKLARHRFVGPLPAHPPAVLLCVPLPCCPLLLLLLVPTLLLICAQLLLCIWRLVGGGQGQADEPRQPPRVHATQRALQLLQQGGIQPRRPCCCCCHCASAGRAASALHSCVGCQLRSVGQRRAARLEDAAEGGEARGGDVGGLAAQLQQGGVVGQGRACMCSMQAARVGLQSRALTLSPRWSDALRTKVNVHRQVCRSPRSAWGPTCCRSVGGLRPAKALVGLLALGSSPLGLGGQLRGKGEKEKGI